MTRGNETKAGAAPADQNAESHSVHTDILRPIPPNIDGAVPYSSACKNP
jgi:hypothetical protein